jgi:hypothetical protein
MRTGKENEPLPALPAPFKQTSPYTLERRESSGWMAVVGVPFLIAGVFLALSLARVLHFEFVPERKWGPPVLGLMSLLFLGLGGVLLFGRRWLMLDLRSGSIVRRQGLVIPMHSEERRLNEFNALVIAFDAGGSESPDRYPVRLRAMSGKDFVISTPGKFSESRKQAEYLCRFLRLPLIDTTTDHESVVSPERVSDSLRERLLSRDVEAERVVPPLRMRCEVSESGGGATIVIPGPKGLQAVGVGALLPTVVLLIATPMFVRFFLRNPSQWVIELAIVIVILGIPSIAAGVNLMVGGRRRGTTVKVSPAGLVIERRSGWRTRTKVVSAEDILDMDYSTFEGALGSARGSSATIATPGPRTQRIFAALRKLVPNKGIVVKAREELITFGEGLP